mmetsp:Transcript_26988/g.69981  ORF Transcript_26988/g.69981 Transcript_26988/m.69981 type:complete len:1010 (+) Transcript_26988:157-3186(+)
MAAAFRALPDLDLSGDIWTAPMALGPEDGSLRHGTFANGMTYYVRGCKKPAARAALALAVRVGSVLEEEEERGVAHIVEHLAFNATDGYSNHDIVKFLESIGAEFGACQNAYTTCDETVYELMVPTDDLSLLGKAFHVMGEFATKVRCAAEDLEKERGAVMEEWRMGNDSLGRAAQAHWRFMLQGSKYAERLPIGLESVIQGVSPAVVKAFYERWYRPGNMALVVAGDFADLDAVVALMAEAVGGAQPRSAAPGPPVPAVGFAPHDAPRCTAFEDRETVQAQVHISFKQLRPGCRTPAEFHEYLKEQMFHSMLNNRLFKISRREKPPFYVAQSSSEPLSTSIQTMCVSASVAEGGAAPAAEAMLVELARVRLHGFSEREVKIARQQLMSEAETTWTQRDQSYSQDVADEYVRHFLNSELVVGQDMEARLTKTLLPKILADELRPFADAMSPSSSCAIKTVEHRKGTSEAQLLDVLARVSEMEAAGSITPWEEDDIPEHIMDPSKVEPGSVTAQRDYPKLAATELTLSNGMRCCCKHTKLLEDQVLLTGFACGGLTEVPQAEFRSASLAPVIAGELGVFGVRPAVAGDILAGKRVEIKPGEGAFWRSFSGDQSPEDLETALQLVYKLFTSRVQPVAEELSAVMHMTRETIAAQIRDPMHTFSNRVRFINYGRCYYFAPFSMREFRAVDAQVACDHFNEAYANPEEYTVCLTGNIDLEKIKPLLEKYLASIPRQATPKKISPREVTPLPYSFPKGRVEEDVRVPMVSPITQTQITFPVDIERAGAAREAVWISICCRLLESRLMQLMRFKFGEVYTVSVSPFFGATAPSRKGVVSGDIALGFSCDPANSRKLVELALREIVELQESGPTADDVTTVLTLEQRQFELQQEENSYWHEQIVGGFQSWTFQETGDLDATFSLRQDARKEVIGSADPETVKMALRRLIPYPATERYTVVTMVPRAPWLARIASSLRGIAASVTGISGGVALVGLGIVTLAAGVVALRAGRGSKAS